MRARSRGHDERPWLYGCLLLSNAGSLLLPGSNLTNLIVVGHLHVSGGAFFVRMAPAWLAAVVVTAVVVAVVERRSPCAPVTETARPTDRATIGLGLAGGGRRHRPRRRPALAGAPGGGGRDRGGRRRRWPPAGNAADRVVAALGLPVLAGLFGVAVALGALGRSWSGPATAAVPPRFLGHRGGGGGGQRPLSTTSPPPPSWPSRVPPRPYALLVGLDIGPNLFVTGSLSWILWLTGRRRRRCPPLGHEGQRPRGAVGAPVHGRRRGHVVPHRIALRRVSGDGRRGRQRWRADSDHAQQGPGETAHLVVGELIGCPPGHRDVSSPSAAGVPPMTVASKTVET